MQTTERPAIAQEQAADALDAVRLGGDPTVELRNAGGRVAWGDDATQRVHSVAFVHLAAVMRELLDREALAAERAALEEELAAREAELVGRMEAFNAQYRNLAPGDPRVEEARALFQQLQVDREAWQRESIEKSGQLAARQMGVAFEEARAAIDRIAERRGIDIVYRFVPGDTAFDAETHDQAMLSIETRTALRYPADLDITGDVLAELGSE
jgi:Skp family chaperone for outer membrane proteins